MKTVTKKSVIAAVILFFAGILWYPVVGEAWLHELGHVFFAFISGGSGSVGNATTAYTNSNFPGFVSIGGALFTLLFAGAVFNIGMKYARPWIGAFWMGKAFEEIVTFIGSSDQRNSGVSTGVWLLISLFIVGFTVLLAIGLGAKHRWERVAKKPRKVYN